MLTKIRNTKTGKESFDITHHNNDLESSDVKIQINTVSMDDSVPLSMGGEATLSDLEEMLNLLSGIAENMKADASD